MTLDRSPVGVGKRGTRTRFGRFTRRRFWRAGGGLVVRVGLMRVRVPRPVPIAVPFMGSRPSSLPPGAPAAKRSPTMRYQSTRGAAPSLGFRDVTQTGLAADGGLYSAVASASRSCGGHPSQSVGRSLGVDK